MDRSKESLADEIAKLKKEKNAVILVHNYQRLEVQGVADFIGDSLGLAKQAAETDADIIVFCGVSFMAETAKILSPQKKVLLPVKEATCPMADMITADELLALKEKYPDAMVVCYVNTNADVKAVSDVCCTSANAVKVVKNIDDRIIFVPDRNLAAFCQRFTSKEIIPWDGYCYVHEKFSRDEVVRAKSAFPDAPLVVHPECTPDVIDEADEVLSTSGMVRFARETDAEVVLIGTEEGLIQRLNKEFPQKRFYSAGTPKICHNMKLTTLEDVYNALEYERFEVELPQEIMDRSKVALERMLQYV